MSLQPPRDGAYAWVLRIEFTDPQGLGMFLLMLRREWGITESAIAEEDYMVIGDAIEFMGPVIRIWRDDFDHLVDAIGWIAVVAEVVEFSVKRTK